jgi:hypothetical protein
MEEKRERREQGISRPCAAAWRLPHTQAPESRSRPRDLPRALSRSLGSGLPPVTAESEPLYMRANTGQHCEQQTRYSGRCSQKVNNATRTPEDPIGLNSVSGLRKKSPEATKTHVLHAKAKQSSCCRYRSQFRRLAKLGIGVMDRCKDHAVGAADVVSCRSPIR